MSVNEIFNMYFGIANLEYMNNKLIGTYWTDREFNNGKNTRGTMQLVKSSVLKF